MVQRYVKLLPQPEETDPAQRLNAYVARGGVVTRSPRLCPPACPPDPARAANLKRPRQDSNLGPAD